MSNKKFLHSSIFLHKYSVQIDMKATIFVEYTALIKFVSCDVFFHKRIRAIQSTTDRKLEKMDFEIEDIHRY